MMGPYGWYGVGGGWMAVGWAIMVLFWVLVIVGVVALVRVAVHGVDRGARPETPMDILRRRYAAGEISREEFEQMARDLGEASITPPGPARRPTATGGA